MTNQVPENALSASTSEAAALQTVQGDALDRVSDQHNAVSLVLFAGTLVLIVGAALFVTVALNPKDAVFGKLPWFYSAICLLGSISCGVVWYRRERADH